MDHTVTMVQEYIAHSRIGGSSVAPDASRSKHGRILVRAKWMHDTAEKNETAQEIVRAIVSLFPPTTSGKSPRLSVRRDGWLTAYLKGRS